MMTFVGFSTRVSLCMSSYRYWIKCVGNFFLDFYLASNLCLAFYPLLWKLIVVVHHTWRPVEGLLSLWIARGEMNNFWCWGFFSPLCQEGFYFFLLLSDGIYFPSSWYSNNVSMSAVLNSSVKLINVLTDSFGQLQSGKGFLQLESNRPWWDHKGSSNQSRKSASFNLFLTL